MSGTPGVVLKAASAVLLHLPSFVRYGSRPARATPAERERLLGALRDYDAALAYPPNQVFIGNLPPEALWDVPKPWYAHPCSRADRWGPFGEILAEEDVYPWLLLADEFDLIRVAPATFEDARGRLAAHPLAKPEDLERLTQKRDKVTGPAFEGSGTVPLFHQRTRQVGVIREDHEADTSLKADILLENLIAKASGALALRYALRLVGPQAAQAVDYVIGCSEEAVGDRYQRGGGNMGKAIAEMAGCLQSSGADVKNFCAAPIPALVMGASLVAAGVFRTVGVVAGGSVPKLGMKFQGHLRHQIPILEDVVGGLACVLTADDGESPVLRLDVVGKENVDNAGSPLAAMAALVRTPLERAGRRLDGVTKYATELHNPEITIPGGGGDVPARNYRMIGALAAERGEIAPAEVEAFVQRCGMPGFAPTQGHIASAACYGGHARALLAKEPGRSVMLLAKGSLFLGRMTQLSDGMSVLVETNPARGAGTTRP